MLQNQRAKDTFVDICSIVPSKSTLHIPLCKLVFLLRPQSRIKRDQLLTRTGLDGCRLAWWSCDRRMHWLLCLHVTSSVMRMCHVRCHRRKRRQTCRVHTYATVTSNNVFLASTARNHRLLKMQNLTIFRAQASSKPDRI